MHDCIDISHLHTPLSTDLAGVLCHREQARCLQVGSDLLSQTHLVPIELIYRARLFGCLFERDSGLEFYLDTDLKLLIELPQVIVITGSS